MPVGADGVCQACGQVVVVILLLWFKCRLVALGLLGLSLWLLDAWVVLIVIPWVFSLVGLLFVPGVWACLYLVGLPVDIGWLCLGLIPLFLYL